MLDTKTKHATECAVGLLTTQQDVRVAKQHLGQVSDTVRRNRTLSGIHVHVGH